VFYASGGSWSNQDRAATSPPPSAWPLLLNCAVLRSRPRRRAAPLARSQRRALPWDARAAHAGPHLTATDQAASHGAQPSTARGYLPRSRLSGVASNRAGTTPRATLPISRYRSNSVPGRFRSMCRSSSPCMSAGQSKPIARSASATSM